MRIIIIVLAIFLLYVVAKSLVYNKNKAKKKVVNEIRFCKYCNAYVTNNDYCGNNNINHKECKNYK